MIASPGYIYMKMSMKYMWNNECYFIGDKYKSERKIWHDY